MCRGASTMALELRLGPITRLIGEKGSLGDEGCMPRVVARACWGGELVLVEGRRMLSGARLKDVGLEEVRRSR